MRKIIIGILFYCLSTVGYAASVTYKSVYNEPKKTVPEYSYPQYSHNSSHNHRPQYPYSTHHYPQRPQVSVVTPNVQIYVAPQTQYHYQKTEEVYLPQGGTYRKTTDYIPQYPRYTPIQPHSGKVLQQGHFYIEQDSD